MNRDIQQFQNELGGMRKAVEAFSRAYPSVASELRLSAGHSADPHVEQLLQSFAWLTASLRNDLQQQKHEIPNHLLLSLYPALMRSIPCMTIMQANVLLDGANFINGYTLEKGRLFSAKSISRRDAGQKPVECRMQCCYDTPLWPFLLEDVAVKPKNIFEFLGGRNDVQSVISIKMRSEGTDPVYEYPLQRLRFFINDPALRPDLYKLLSDHICGIAIRVDGEIVPLPEAGIEWLGFDQQHNVLPQPNGSHDAYRLLQEYFYFPEKYYFFEITGLDVSRVSSQFELLLLVNQPDSMPALERNSLSFNSFPAINLFPATFCPVQLDHSCYEYRLYADESQYGQSEVHSVENVRLLSADGRVKTATPWLGHAGVDDIRDAGVRYLTRLVAPLSPATPGCDTMISLQDLDLTPATPVDQTLSVKGLCNNRTLPESLRIGNRLKLTGAGALLDATIITRPSLFRGEGLSGEANINLLSQLHLNFLSLLPEADDGHPLARLKQLIALYSDPQNASHQRQLDGLVNIQAESCVRRMGREAWRGHYRGSRITLTVDEAFFDGANALLLGEVMSHFLGLYTTLNHFVQLQLVSYQREGVWKQWHPRIGEQVIL
ncbi:MULTISPECIES: type VI secretion system baseplate subunit TssF [unclassified Thalassolituus]|uniref:type VI secretion system baseplate subunit TssF n=1 Tax=Oceanospirillaceae TaxID=135620 RepID=UPI000C3D0394|nr:MULTISPECIES: type VI secretion system baseplate subunit TssF [unclassified Thalassolituus]MCA6061023.1 type VI secretion system baseplate subunit TssF [Thalassolituus sp. ST750PaO-4]PIQ40107.1 MAG: type VI secretion system baseplate subunit TssF [Thalassolituus sp. CG17_big_fil_post_rev_8_21_14_2_50_53_8]TVV43835.1 type VI secretion system baseplate subunit TssF [Thalassolituus sp. C2-1]